MGILATSSPFLHIHMLHGSYPQRRRSIARETLDLMPAHILLPTRKLEQEMQDFYQGLQPVDVRSMLRDSMCKLVSIVTNEAFCNTKLLHDMQEGFSYSVLATAAVKSLFCVGFEKSIGNLKRCMGGVGKTALALALCNKGCFQILLFIALSVSPYLQGLVELMWDGFVGRNIYGFRNVEDACMQQQIQLPRQSKSTPLTLDDVGSRENMEKSLFQVAGFKTLLTARQRSITPKNYSIQNDQLPLLGQDDALSLFCFHIEPCEAWQSSMTKLSKGELVSDYHLDGLLGFFDTSNSFPVDKKTCTDVLLYIWVYVRKLEWLEAFTIFLELASRNLWNLISKYRSTAATFYGYAAEHYFSQYYAMRELVLHLGGKGIAFQKNRVACSWEKLLKARPFDAQIASLQDCTDGFVPI